MLLDVLSTFCTLFAISTTVECRDMVKTFKTIPTITNSLVNLGKMDVSIYLNPKDSPMKEGQGSGPSSSYLFSKSEPVEEPCPCSSLRGFKDPFTQNPSDILNKLLMSNDLFSYKEPMTSTLCCDSHEHDEFVTFEFNNRHAINANPIQPNAGSFPFIFDNLLPRKPLPPPPAQKARAVEIFLFPRKKDSFLLPMKNNNNPIKKESIQVVGDKELRNDFKSGMFKPTTSASVKKDLNAQERSEMKKTDDVEDIHVFSTVKHMNAL